MRPEVWALDLPLRLRELSCVPVIVLTARGEEIDRVLGLKLGADNFVATPFAPRGLVARVRVLLRCAGPDAEAAAGSLSRRIAFAGWILDIAWRELV